MYHTQYLAPRLSQDYVCVNMPMKLNTDASELYGCNYGEMGAAKHIYDFVYCCTLYCKRFQLHEKVILCCILCDNHSLKVFHIA